MKAEENHRNLSVFRDAILQIASGYLTYWYSGASAKTGMKKKIELNTETER